MRPFRSQSRFLIVFDAVLLRFFKLLYPENGAENRGWKLKNPTENRLTIGRRCGKNSSPCQKKAWSGVAARQSGGYNRHQLILYGGIFVSTARHCSILGAVVCGRPCACRCLTPVREPAYPPPFLRLHGRKSNLGGQRNGICKSTAKDCTRNTSGSFS